MSLSVQAIGAPQTGSELLPGAKKLHRIKVVGPAYSDRIRADVARLIGVRSSEVTAKQCFDFGRPGVSEVLEAAIKDGRESCGDKAWLPTPGYHAANLLVSDPLLRAASQGTLQAKDLVIEVTRREKFMAVSQQLAAMTRQADQLYQTKNSEAESAELFQPGRFIDGYNALINETSRDVRRVLEPQFEAASISGLKLIIEAATYAHRVVAVLEETQSHEFKNIGIGLTLNQDGTLANDKTPFEAVAKMLQDFQQASGIEITVVLNCGSLRGMKKALIVADVFGLKIKAIYPNSLDIDLAVLLRMSEETLSKAGDQHGTSVADILEVASEHQVEAIGPCCGFPFGTKDFSAAARADTWS